MSWGWAGFDSSKCYKPPKFTHIEKRAEKMASLLKSLNLFCIDIHTCIVGVKAIPKMASLLKSLNLFCIDIHTCIVGVKAIVELS